MTIMDLEHFVYLKIEYSCAFKLKKNNNKNNTRKHLYNTSSAARRRSTKSGSNLSVEAFCQAYDAYKDNIIYSYQ